ncbi:ornithine cyclodeaminase family protein [soil metagenome]
MPVLHLTEADVERHLTMEMALDAVAAAFRKLSLDEAVNPPRQRVQTDKIMLHVLPAAAKTLGALGFKAYTSGPDGAQFHVMLFDSKKGGLTAMIEADYLGRMRTGAASGVATKKLARTNANTVGILGAGGQAMTQLEAICKVRTIRVAKVYTRNVERAKEFASEMSTKCGTKVIAVTSAEDAVREMDIVVTATSSREPVLKGEWLPPGCHVNLIGSNYLSKAEADVEVFRRATLITADSKEQARLEAGDFVAAMEAGVFGWSDVLEFCHVLTGRYPGRESETDITVFKSLGLGIEDIAVAVKVVEQMQR